MDTSPTKNPPPLRSGKLLLWHTIPPLSSPEPDPVRGGPALTGATIPLQVLKACLNESKELNETILRCLADRLRQVQWLQTANMELWDDLSDALQAHKDLEGQLCCATDNVWQLHKELGVAHGHAEQGGASSHGHPSLLSPQSGGVPPLHQCWLHSQTGCGLC